MKNTIPKTHPRYSLLKTRTHIVQGVKQGITSIDGLIAHGRGEAFDYLLSEKTHDFAKKAITASAALLLLAKHPIISVNGNTAALVGEILVTLSEVLSAPLEINIFHSSKAREQRIKKHLQVLGGTKILLPDKNYEIKYLDSNRKFVHSAGIFAADVVFVPLEDGDRAEALVKNGKRVIALDLNPLSRSAQQSTITIVDNVTRALPLLVLQIRKFRNQPKKVLVEYLQEYNNKEVLRKALQTIKI